MITEAEAPGTWSYSFSVGNRNFSGRVQAVLGLLAARRVKMKIDRALLHDASTEAHTDAVTKPDASPTSTPSPVNRSGSATPSNTVAFTCAACNASYEAVQVRTAAKGIFRCTACYWPVHQWDGAHDYRSWRRKT
ncbi:hypothetical protein QA641_10310 [Bradyrhizobium sp. CB1650]|uniref:hypothetical protein n=1 Tax=Bradyrhizobium sp. CB1650 TaxID=3039153 RepID=UPI0024355A18|nr:hypothetical protein [Bradyrhizobium sp. CB1650]WGD54248.1 hypothetical protein QA641_10310 [Bradyrhizobium sp. CB1650]